MREPASLTNVRITSEDNHHEFARPLWEQMYYVTHRAFQQHWRTPKYVIVKVGLGIASSL